MAQILINEYLEQLGVIKKVSGRSRETIVREAFKDLLKAWRGQISRIFWRCGRCQCDLKSICSDCANG